MFRKILFFSMLAWAVTGIFLVSMTNYFDNQKKILSLLDSVSTKLKSYNTAEIHKDNALSEEATQLKDVEASLKTNKDILTSNLYILQSDVTSNQFKTLTAISVKFAERYMKSNYEDSKILISDMRSIVTSSGLPSETKIRLFKELRDVEQPLIEITDNITEIKDLTYKLNSKREDINKKFFADILDKTEKEKNELSKTAELKQLITIICIIVLVFGIFGIAVDMYISNRKLKKDTDILFSAIESVHAGAEPEVIERHKTLPILRKLKNQIYEVIKVQTEELNFIKHCINSINTPIMLKTGENVFKNKAMGDICINLAVIPSNLGDEFYYNNMLYIKTEQPHGICIIPIKWEKIRSYVETETAFGIKTNDTSRLIPSLHGLNNELKKSYSNITLKNKTLSFYRTRLRNTISVLRKTRLESSSKDKSVTSIISRGRVLLEDGVTMSSSIKVFGIKVSDLYAVLKNLSVFNSRIEDGNNIVTEQINVIELLISLLKSNRSWFEQTINNLELGKISGVSKNELDENISRINKSILSLEQILVSYKKMSSISSNDFAPKLTKSIETLVEAYKNVFNLADRINNGLETLAKSDMDMEASS